MRQRADAQGFSTSDRGQKSHIYQCDNRIRRVNPPKGNHERPQTAAHIQIRHDDQGPPIKSCDEKA